MAQKVQSCFWPQSETVGSGFSSGYFSRLVKQGDSCQAHQGRAPDVMPSPPRASPSSKAASARQAPPPKAAPVAPPEAGPQSDAAPENRHQAEDDAKLAQSKGRKKLKLPLLYKK